MNELSPHPEPSKSHKEGLLFGIPPGAAFFCGGAYFVTEKGIKICQ